MPTSVIVHYQELALKGRNRPWFVERLVSHLREALGDLEGAAVRPLMGRILVTCADSVDRERLADRLSRVFGVANFGVARAVPRDLDGMAAAIVDVLRGESPASFRVTARRADKRFPLTSPEIEREIGGRVKSAFGWPVRLAGAELTLYLEVLPDEVFFLARKTKGPGGLPTGVSGKVVCLLSGGIDSPVAAWRMMKRGCRVRFVHFHSYPIVSRTSQEKVQQIVELLTRYQLRSRLLMVPFGDVQRRVITTVPPPLRVVIYRRLMMRIAERLARRAGARALVTGEVVGQVASQTLDNMATIDAAARMVVLRPLVGMDKDEITAEAQALGTYPISIVPDEDCCQVFTPKHPATAARPDRVEAAEAELPIDELVAGAVKAAETHEHRFPQVPRTVA